jgi:hypothetical protein
MSSSVETVFVRENWKAMEIISAFKSLEEAV